MTLHLQIKLWCDFHPHQWYMVFSSFWDSLSSHTLTWLTGHACCHLHPAHGAFSLFSCAPRCPFVTLCYYWDCIVNKSFKKYANGCLVVFAGAVRSSFWCPNEATSNCNQFRPTPDIVGPKLDHLGLVYFGLWTKKRLVQTGFLS